MRSWRLRRTEFLKTHCAFLPLRFRWVLVHIYACDWRFTFKVGQLSCFEEMFFRVQLCFGSTGRWRVGFRRAGLACFGRAGGGVFLLSLPAPVVSAGAVVTGVGAMVGRALRWGTRTAPAPASQGAWGWQLDRLWRRLSAWRRAPRRAASRRRRSNALRCSNARRRRSAARCFALAPEPPPAPLLPWSVLTTGCPRPPGAAPLGVDVPGVSVAAGVRSGPARPRPDSCTAGSVPGTPAVPAPSAGVSAVGDPGAGAEGELG